METINVKVISTGKVNQIRIYKYMDGSFRSSIRFIKTWFPLIDKGYKTLNGAKKAAAKYLKMNGFAFNETELEKLIAY